MTNDIDKTTSSAKGEHLAAGGIDKAKRSLMSKAAVIAPVALVAMSRPAWGDKTGIKFRCGISGMASGNVSVREEQYSCNGGLSPGYWGNPNGWCRWSTNHNDSFEDLFGSSSCLGDTDKDGNPKHFDYSNKKLGEILAPSNENSYRDCDLYGFRPNNDYSGSFGWHAIAAWLNSKHVDGYIFSESDVISLVTTAMSQGSVDIGQISYSCSQLKALFDSTY